MTPKSMDGAVQGSPWGARALRRLLDRYELRPRGSLGQNFLVDPDVAERVVEAAELTGAEGVLEIGPGAGALTWLLSERARQVLAVELDRGLAELLRAELAARENVTVLEGDAVKVELAGRMGELLPPNSVWKIVANLPYYVTGPLLARLLTEMAAARLVVMVQWEVARRIVAPPGGKEYGAFSVLCQVHARPEILFQVPPGAFFPQPEVSSAVVRLWPDEAPELRVERSALLAVSRAAFGQRRKNLRNSLSGLMNGEKQQVERACARAGINIQARAEQLSLDDFSRLTEALQAEGWAAGGR